MRVYGTDLYMTRGDTESITITFNGYTPVDGDVIKFTVRQTIESAVALYKEITTFDGNQATIPIEPEDTESLAFGTYLYDIQLTYSGNVKTIVTPSKFVIGLEVTYGYNS